METGIFPKLLTSKIWVLGCCGWTLNCCAMHTWHNIYLPSNHLRIRSTCQEECVPRLCSAQVCSTESVYPLLSQKTCVQHHPTRSIELQNLTCHSHLLEGNVQHRRQNQKQIEFHPVAPWHDNHRIATVPCDWIQVQFQYRNGGSLKFLVIPHFAIGGTRVLTASKVNQALLASSVHGVRTQNSHLTWQIKADYITITSPLRSHYVPITSPLPLV